MSTVVPLHHAKEDYCQPPPRFAVRLARLALMAGIGISGYLLYSAWTGGTVLGCDPDASLSCDKVLKSQYAYWFNLPVSLFALVTYVVALASLTGVSGARTASTQRDAWRLLIVLATAIVGAVAWFVGLQWFEIGAFCPWCVASHVCGLVFAAVVFLFGPLSARTISPESHERIRPLGFLGGAAPMLLGWAGVCVLVFGQMYGPEPSGMLVQNVDDVLPPAKPESKRRAPESKPVKPAEPTKAIDSKPDSTSDPEKPTAETSEEPLPSEKVPAETSESSEAGILSLDPKVPDPPPDPEATTEDTPSAEPAKSSSPTPIGTLTPEDLKLPTLVANPARQSADEDFSNDTWDPTPVKQEMVIGKRNHKIDLGEFPVIGSRNGKHRALKFFDYTCSHCRSLHQYLNAAQKRYGPRQLAIVLVAVPMNRKCNAFVQNDNPQHRQSCEYARLALAVWKTDPAVFAEFHHWLMDANIIPTLDESYKKAIGMVSEESLKATLEDAWINTRIEANTEMYKLAGAGTIPKLMCGPLLVLGEPNSQREFHEFLEKRLGLVPRVAEESSAAKPNARQ